jgi:hypothetical protein
MELPTGFPPDAGFDTDMVLSEAIAQSVHGAAMTFFNCDGLALVSAHDGAVREFGGESGVKGVVVFGGGDIETEPGAEAELAPFPDAKLEVANANAIGVVEDFDFAFMTADDEASVRDGMGEIAKFARQRFLRRLPEMMVQREEKWRETFGSPIN